MADPPLWVSGLEACGTQDRKGDLKSICSSCLDIYTSTRWVQELEFIDIFRYTYVYIYMCPHTPIYLSICLSIQLAIYLSTYLPTGAGLTRIAVRKYTSFGVHAAGKHLGNGPGMLPNINDLSVYMGIQHFGYASIMLPSSR